MESLLQHPKVIAIGEMGLDFSIHHLKQNPKHLQRDSLERQVIISALVAKPVIFHLRECHNEVLVMAKKHLPRYTKVHIYSCTLPWSQMMAWIRSFPNSYFGITSAITHEEEEDVWEVPICAPLHKPSCYGDRRSIFSTEARSFQSSLKRSFDGTSGR